MQGEKDETDLDGPRVCATRQAIEHHVLVLVHGATFQLVIQPFHHAPRRGVLNRDQANERRQSELRQTDAGEYLGDLASEALPPQRTLESVGNLDLVDTLDKDVTDARAAGKRTVFRSQYPKAEAVPVPMGDVVDEIGLCLVRRAHAAEIARHLGIEVQFDEIGEMILAELFGGEPSGGEMIHAGPVPNPPSANLMVRRRVSAVSNHAASAVVASSFETPLARLLRVRGWTACEANYSPYSQDHVEKSFSNCGTSFQTPF